MNINLEEIQALRMLTNNRVETPIDISLARKYFVDNNTYIFIDHDLLKEINKGIESEIDRLKKENKFSPANKDLIKDKLFLESIIKISNEKDENKQDARLQKFKSKSELDATLADLSVRNPEYKDKITTPIQLTTIDFLITQNQQVITPRQTEVLKVVSEKVISLMEDRKIDPYFKLNDLVNYFKENRQEIGKKSIVEIAQSITAKKEQKKEISLAA